MIGKLVFLAVFGFSSALEYPDGLNPELCPNYPYCDVGVLERLAYYKMKNVDVSPEEESGVPAEFEGGAARMLPALPMTGTYMPKASGQILVEAEMPSHAYSFKTSAYPSGDWNEMNAKTFETPDAYQVKVAPIVSADPLKFPAGVDPAACPNYPLC